MMIKHKKIYCDFFGYTNADFIGCECGCNRMIVDIHHLSKRGMGGSNIKDRIFNLSGVTRLCHIEADNKTEFNNALTKNHLSNVINFAENNRVKVKWFLNKYPENKPDFEWLQK